MKSKRLIYTIPLLFLIVFFFLIKSPQINPASVSTPAPTSPAKATATASPFPQKHLIKTTFIQQAPARNWDQPWQDACEEAALLTTHFYYQNQNPNQNQISQAILDMIDYETTQGYTKDVNIAQMAQIAQDYLGYQTKIIDHPGLDQIKQFVLADIPVIIPANGKTLFTENQYFNSGGPYYHNLTILGFDDTKEQFTVHDVGTRHGAYFKYSYTLLMDSIHDFPDSQNKQNINQGIPRILILLK